MSVTPVSLTRRGCCRARSPLLLAIVRTKLIEFKFRLAPMGSRELGFRLQPRVSGMAKESREYCSVSALREDAI